MARGKGKHAIEIPDYLWHVLDKTAEAKNISTAQLIATWLTESAHRHARDPYSNTRLGVELLALPAVDGRYTYPRRDPSRALGVAGLTRQEERDAQ